MEQFAKLGPVAALIRLWNELTPAQRVVVTAFAVLSVMLLMIGASSLNKPKMEVLFSGLSQEDAGAIVQKLSESKTEYHLSPDGTTVEVPSNRAAELRLEMAGEGLPRGSVVGFEAFDKSTFGMTEFMEKTNFQRATEGELTRTICSLAPVMGARVHITMPDDSVYATEQEEAKAAVLLKLRRGQPLGDEQVAAIVHLVSSSVKGLRPECVTVTDSEGNVLAEGPAMKAGGGLMTNNQVKLKQQYEADIAQKVKKLLAKTVGADKAEVSVSADLAFDQTQTKTETYKPAVSGGTETNAAGQVVTRDAKGVLLTEERKSEDYSGSVVPMGGNVTTANGTGGPNDKYMRSETTAQYGVDKTIEETVKAPGTVKRLSVAVLVDEKVPPASLGVIKEAVRAAAGIDEKTRGDVLTVDRMAFDTSEQKAIAAEMANESRNELIMVIAKNAGAVIIVLLFLVFLKRIIKQIKMPVAPAPEPVVAEEPSPLDKMPNPADLLKGMGMPAYPPVAPEPEYIPPKPENPIPPEITNSNPEELARLVRTWMSEQ